MQLDDESKKDAVRIKQRLREAFDEDPYTAYEKLISKRLQGEQMDIYLTDIKKLTKAAGIIDENLIKRTFVVGLPVRISKELRVIKNLAEVSTEELVAKGRVLASLEGNECSTVKSVDSKINNGDTNKEGEKKFASQSMNKRKYNNPVHCFICQKEGHIARHCDQQNFHYYGKNRNKEITCWRCSNQGHKAYECGMAAANEEDGTLGQLEGVSSEK